MPVQYMDNTLKRRLKNKERVAGAWIHSCSPIAASIIANAGFDFAVMDMEHSPLDFGLLPGMIGALNGTPCVPIVRAPWNNMVDIKRILDCGAYGIHVPFVCTVEEAKQAVSYCKYPPLGVRGAAGCTYAAQFNLKRGEYFSRANDETLVMIAVENRKGAENAEAFTHIDGVDGIFIGPSDLGASMGYLNQASDEVQRVIRGIEDVVVKSDKFLGTIANSMEEASRLYARGYNYIVVMSDVVALAGIARAQAEQARTLCQ